MRAAILRFLRDEKGATAVEYAMIAAFICIAIVVAVLALGQGLTGLYQGVMGAF